MEEKEKDFDLEVWKKLAPYLWIEEETGIYKLLPWINLIINIILLIIILFKL